MNNRLRSMLALLGWVAFSFVASTTGAVVSTRGWYTELAKPSWSPPAWVFAPVWTTLYLLIGIAAWLVWRRGGWSQQRRPLTGWVVQWALNVAWTPLFFGLHWIGTATVEIVALWLAILMTIVSFARASRLAAALLVPYLAWVSFAIALTFAIWRLNPA